MLSICSLYLNQPRKKWFSNKPLGHQTLSTTVARLCKSAGISGFKTNHSLRATAATRLYQSGVDEQLVMERTGHRSLDGVRNYKRTSNAQREELSDILNCKRPYLDLQSSAKMQVAATIPGVYLSSCSSMTHHNK